jgi:hypothetical protein
MVTSASLPAAAGRTRNARKLRTRTRRIGHFPDRWSVYVHLEARDMPDWKGCTRATTAFRREEACSDCSECASQVHGPARTDLARSSGHQILDAATGRPPDRRVGAHDPEQDRLVELPGRRRAFAQRLRSPEEGAPRLRRLCSIAFPLPCDVASRSIASSSHPAPNASLGAMFQRRRSPWHIACSRARSWRPNLDPRPCRMGPWQRMLRDGIPPPGRASR